MELFLQFLVAKWYLAGAWLVLLALVFMQEKRRGGQSVSPASLTNLVNREGGVVLDVRDAGEYRAGHIVESLNIPHARVAQQLGELDKFRDKPLVIVCKHGQHSGAVARTLKEGGFDQVFKLGGGIAEWQNAQLPLVKS